MSSSTGYAGPGLLTIGQASKLLNVHPSTLRRWDEAGKVTALRTPGGRRRYRQADLEQMRVDGAATTPVPA